MVYRITLRWGHCGFGAIRFCWNQGAKDLAIPHLDRVSTLTVIVLGITRGTENGSWKIRIGPDGANVAFGRSRRRRIRPSGAAATTPGSVESRKGSKLARVASIIIGWTVIPHSSWSTRSSSVRVGTLRGMVAALGARLVNRDTRRTRRQGVTLADDANEQ